MPITEQELVKIAEDMRVNLEQWQIELILDRETKRWCLNCGRKRGKTTAIQFRTAVRILNDDVKGSGLIGGVAIISKELKAAKQILAGVKTILSAIGWRFSSEPKYLSEENRVAFATTTEIYMPNGNRAMVFATGHTGDAIRPYSFHEFIYDEADFIQDDVYVATNPCLARFDGVEILESTPNTLGDRTTYFAKAFFGERSDYRVLHLPSTGSKHIPKEWLERERKTKTTREYAREILAEYVSDISCVFPNEIINSCMDDNIEWLAQNVFIGAQYAAFNAESSVIAENYYKDGISNIRIYVIPQYGRRIMEAENQIVDLVNSHGVQRVCINNTTLGSAPLESMAALIGEEKVFGVSNHETKEELDGVRRKYMKEDLYVNMLKLMERGSIKFDDPRIQAAMMDVRYDYSKRTKTIWIIGNDIMDAVVRAVFPVWGRKEWLDGKMQIFFEKYK